MSQARRHTTTKAHRRPATTRRAWVAAAASSQRMRTARSAAEPRGGTRRLVQTRTVEGVRSSIDARHGFLRPRAQAASGLEAIVARMTAGMHTRMGMETPPRGALGGARVLGNTRRCSSHGSSMLTPRGSWTSGSTSCDASSRRSRHFRSRRPPRRLVDRLARILGHCDPDGELQMEFE